MIFYQYFNRFKENKEMNDKVPLTGEKNLWKNEKQHSIEDETLEKANPQYCIQLLENPTATTLAKLQKKFKSSKNEWIHEFILHGGLIKTLECLERLSKKKLEIKTTLVLVKCVKCLKELMNKESGIDAVIKIIKTNPESSLKALTNTLSSGAVLVKQELFFLFSALNLYSDEGYVATQTFLNKIKV